MSLIRGQGNPNLSDVSDAILKSYGSSGQVGIDDSLKQSAAGKIQAQQNVLSVMKDLSTQGNADAEAVDKAISRFAGDDPVAYEKMLRELHNDPEPVSRMNAVTKAAMVASKLGIRKPVLKAIPYGSRLVDENTGEVVLNVDPTIANLKSQGSGTEFERLAAKIGAGTATPEEIQRVQTIARGGMDPQARSFNSALGKDRGQNYADLQQSVGDSEQALADIQLAKNAVEKLGGWQGPIVGRLTPNLSAEAQLIDSASTVDALTYVNKTKGAVSDREMAMFKGASIGTDKGEQFNKNKLAAAEAILTRNLQKADFKESWLAKYGNLDGSDRAFKQFADENPIFEIQGTKFKWIRNPEDVRQDRAYLNYIDSAGKATVTPRDNKGRPPLSSFFE